MRLRILVSNIILLFLCASFAIAGVDCDGTDDLLTTSLDAAADCTDTTCTITGWVLSNGGTTEYYISKSATNLGWRLGQTSNHLYVNLREADAGTAAEVQSTATINDNVWHHFAAVITTSTTVSANNVITLYIDGATGQGTTTRGGEGYGPNNDTVRLCGIASGANFFPGSIEDVRIYSGALSAQQILTLAKSRLRGTQVGGTLIAYWPLNQCANGASADGTAFVDASGNGNTATASNGANDTGMVCNTTGAGLLYTGDNR